MKLVMHAVHGETGWRSPAVMCVMCERKLLKGTGTFRAWPKLDLADNQTELPFCFQLIIHIVFMPALLCFRQTKSSICSVKTSDCWMQLLFIM